ncbi:type II toxin-antitoxin system prevent-host-death family antitoxin [Zavarzinia compransoris]|uniref:Type II toxin-antitoxin system prevent-host-death family antitoxin n=1 Tax=Zavarzinia compransoris TaxID=1264899 RepID=A0A317DUU7_9PROT|nr:type II toxin-antitoxin system prevent-host-death family antitoxin [Zavarzinia compransoris]PWR17750.1 type II toxin-antitoxin system prevent-host-death family antitoxin [Zavarzinia compransoris]TDP49275.1 hypothetical protein DES42_101646 [Zavarzinia compransoris]
MGKTISTADADGIPHGERGRPVARIVPADGSDSTASAARAALLSRLEHQPVANVGPWTRAGLYDDER